LAENSNSDEDKRKDAVATIEKATEELQDDYVRVIETANNLRKKLLA
jgi:molecular chaperone GrpE (heat shock protein)